MTSQQTSPPSFITRHAPNPHSRRSVKRKFYAVSAIALSAWFCLTATPSLAQTPVLGSGDTVVTRFSGTLGEAGSPLVLDPDGTVATVVSLGAPGFVPDGRHWKDIVQKLQIPAAQVGQVFGIAIDDAQPANIYLTATSAFGLHRTPEGDAWAPGMWGEGGGPGTVYKLSATNGYQPEVFANITIDDRENTGAGLGNIAYDASHRQLLVTDLETGFINRVSVEDGRILGRFDHGVLARSGFFDVPNETWQTLDQAPFDPASEASLEVCEKAAGGVSGANDPACWNVADFRRRIWGIGVHKNTDAGEVRAFYAVWGSSALGNSEWADAGEDRKNAVWSVAISEDGSFDPETIRRELFVPSFFAGEAGDGEQTESSPVADIAFSKDGQMLLAERGGLRNLGGGENAPFAKPQQSRVLLYKNTNDGEQITWTPEGRYDVGFADKREDGQPHLRANAGGGTDFGFGYDEQGNLNANAPDANVIVSGDRLCTTEAPCTDPQTQDRTDPGRVDGIQVTPAALVSEVAPDAAFQPYPDSGEATTPDGPLQSVMVDPGTASGGAGQPSGGNQASYTGDVESYRGSGVVEPVPSEEPEFADDPEFEPEYEPEFPDDGGGFVPPPPPLHQKWKSNFHQKWASVQHNKFTSKPFPLHLKWKSKFHKKWKSIQHNKATSKPFPLHVKWKSKFHKKWKSIQHNKFTSKPFPLHVKWKSKFHKKWKSIQHNKATSKPFPLHVKWKSKFHKKWKSIQHNKATSKPFPLHVKWKSKFHKKWKSFQHNKKTSKPFPLHVKWKSKFHKKWKSVQHNKKTSKPFTLKPKHVKWKSNFHKKWKSVQHNKKTSKPFTLKPKHVKWKSNFHKKWKSVQHNKKTSKPFTLKPKHIKWKSNFHKKWKSVQHNKKTSRPFTLKPRHIKWRSNFHKKWKSVQHNKVTSKPFTFNRN